MTKPYHHLRAAPALAALLIFMPGCAEVQTAYKSYQDREEMEFVTAAKQACTRYGFKPETDAFAQCVNTNVNAAKDREAFEKAAFHSEKK